MCSRSHDIHHYSLWLPFSYALPNLVQIQIRRRHVKRSLLVLILVWLGWAAVACTPATAPSSVAENAPTIITVYKSPTCGCCDGWIEDVEKHGYRVRVEEITDVTSIKNRYQIPVALQSCHTSLVGGYVVEGHVPIEALEQLLAERPSVKGIAVPGMPIGAPGMEQPGTAPQPYDVMSFDEAGNTAVFSSYTP
jgi:hypothetical protein